MIDKYRQENLTPTDGTAFFLEIKRLTASGWRLCCGCASGENQCKTCPISKRKKMGLPPEERE